MNEIKVNLKVKNVDIDVRIAYGNVIAFFTYHNQKFMVTNRTNTNHKVLRNRITRIINLIDSDDNLPLYDLIDNILIGAIEGFTFVSRISETDVLKHS